MKSSGGSAARCTRPVSFLSMRVASRSDKPLSDVVPGVRRAIFVDAADGARQLSFGAAEIEPGKEIPVHRHRVDERYVEEGFYALHGAPGTAAPGVVLAAGPRVAQVTLSVPALL